MNKNRLVFRALFNINMVHFRVTQYSFLRNIVCKFIYFFGRFEGLHTSFNIYLPLLKQSNSRWAFESSGPGSILGKTLYPHSKLTSLRLGGHMGNGNSNAGGNLTMN